MAEAYMGQIIAFGGNYAIRDWHLCAGELLSISQYVSLYAVMGTTFGGDGYVNFGLPDLRGRSALGAGQMMSGDYYRLGTAAGFERLLIHQPNLPEVTLSVTGTTDESSTVIQASSEGPDTADPEGAFQGTFPETTPVYASTLSTPAKSFGAVKIPPLTLDTRTSPLGSNVPMENRSPYQVVNWLICVDGLYPPRR